MKRFLCAGEGYAQILMFLILFNFCFSKNSFSNNIKSNSWKDVTEIKGIVYSSTTNQPLEGVKVQILGTEDLSFTNKNGEFIIKNRKEKTSLVLTYQNYVLQTYEIENFQLVKNRTRFYLTPLIKDLPHLKLGDTIPDLIWDLPLSIVNHPNERTIITLREYQKKKLIVLDFWAVYCKPCIETINKWEKLIPNFERDLAYLTVHVDFQNYVEPFIKKQGWKSPAVVGDSHLKLNEVFFSRYQLGMVVFIYQGKFYAVPANHGNDKDLLKKLINGEDVNIVSNQSALHNLSN